MERRRGPKRVNPEEGGESALGAARDMADAVVRRSYGKLVAFLATRTHDVAAAEDALSEAFASALAAWSRDRCPSNPEAWLLTVARRKLTDIYRERRRDEDAAPRLTSVAADINSETEIPDQRLALMFVCAHPAIERGIRPALILQVILGLDAKTIASAFLTSPAAMSKRLVRAKNKIREGGHPIRRPGARGTPRPAGRRARGHLRWIH